jgi:hypothetical protein
MADGHEQLLEATTEYDAAERAYLNATRAYRDAQEAYRAAGDRLSRAANRLRTVIRNVAPDVLASTDPNVTPSEEHR